MSHTPPRLPYVPVSLVFLAGAAQLPNFPPRSRITKIRAMPTSTPAIPGLPPLGAIDLNLPWQNQGDTPRLRVPCGDKGIHVAIRPQVDLAIQGTQVTAQYSGWAGGAGGEFTGVVFFDWSYPTEENEKCP